MRKHIPFLITPPIDCILLDHILDRFDNLCIIQDEISEEVYLSQGGLHSFLVDWVRNLRDSSKSVRINLDPTLSDDMHKEVPLRHCKYALHGIQGYLVISTSHENIVEMVQVV